MIELFISAVIGALLGWLAVSLGFALYRWARPWFREWRFERLNKSAERRARLILKDRGLSKAEIEEKIAIGRVRIGFAALGCIEAMDWTDEEIKQTTIEFARLVGGCGIEAEELARGLRALVANVPDDEETVH